MFLILSCQIFINVFNYYHARFQDDEGFKKEIYAIEFLLGQYLVLLDDDRKKVIDLVWMISDRSIKFHFKYMLPTFSNVHEAYIDYELS